MDERLHDLLGRIRAKLRHAGLGVETTLLYQRTAHDVRGRPIAHALQLIALPPDQIARIGDIGPPPGDEALVRLARGDVCYAVWQDGELAHYTWVQTSGAHDIEPLGVVVEIHPDELWIYNCRTAAQFRGRGVYPAALRAIVDDYFAAGCTRAWIYTTDRNIASQRGISRAGFEHVATLRALRLGRRHHPSRRARAQLTAARAGRPPDPR